MSEGTDSLLKTESVQFNNSLSILFLYNIP
jgi:hypothetical protein